MMCSQGSASYYQRLVDVRELDRHVATDSQITEDFLILSSRLVKNVNQAQGLIQDTIFRAWSYSLSEARRDVRSKPGPKARLGLLSSFPHFDSLPRLGVILTYIQLLFDKVYELRNILAHEIWSTSPDYPDAVLFSSLKQEEGMLNLQGEMQQGLCTSQDVYKSLITYISQMKMVKLEGLLAANHDADVCVWSLMHMGTILKEDSEQRREEAMRVFLTFSGTSHLFDESERLSGEALFTRQSSKVIG